MIFRSLSPLFWSGGVSAALSRSRSLRLVLSGAAAVGGAVASLGGRSVAAGAGAAAAFDGLVEPEAGVSSL